jgi:hypothetical protein
MKALIIFGALIGFLIGGAFGIAGRGPWPEALWRACAAALMAAVLTRWWSRVWLNGLRESMEQRRRPRPAASISPKPLTKAKA